MQKLETYVPRKKYLVCVDSDGCAIDGMVLKHVRCFGPAFVEVFGLKENEAKILDRWNVINLYSETRGINRFLGLKMELENCRKDGYIQLDLEPLVQWIANSSEYSNAALQREIEAHPEAEILQKALEWSNEVNRMVKMIPEEDIVPFLPVKETLAMVHESADVAIISSANPEAVQNEWGREGLLDHVDVVMTQECGTKQQCIETMIGKGYEPDRVIMLGDAPGDYKAAGANNALFFGILSKHENESWEDFRDSAFAVFLKDGYKGDVMADYVKRFNDNLNNG